MIERYGPFETEAVGHYLTLSAPRGGGLSFEGFGMVARDGRLVTAEWFTCTGHLTFFDALTPDEHEAANHLYRESRNSIREDRWRATMAVGGAAGFHAGPLAADYRREGGHVAGMAVGGPLGYIALHEPPSPDPEP